MIEINVFYTYLINYQFEYVRESSFISIINILKQCLRNRKAIVASNKDSFKRLFNTMKNMLAKDIKIIKMLSST